MCAPRSSPLLLLALASVAPVRSPLAAQSAPDSGAFVVRLGSDTLALERYRRLPGELRGEVVVRVPEARRMRYVATLHGGGVSALEVELEPLAHGAHGGRTARGVMRFRGDTADVALELEDGVRHVHVPARRGAVPLAAFSHALVEQAILQARRDGRDSVGFDWVGLGAPTAMPSYVVRCGPDSVRVSFFGHPSYVRLNSGGGILRLDGRATTMKVVVERRPSVDLDRWAAAFAAREARSGPMGQLSPRDTMRATIGEAVLTLDYGRPRRRGRAIFGGLVAWSKVWRLGANAATQLSTTAALRAGGHLIPAGAYSLWLLPSPDGAELIVNRQTGQWGTAYDPAYDLARVPMAPYRPARAVEQLTLEVEPSSGGGTLRLTWDTVGYALPFRLADSLPPDAGATAATR